MSHFNRTILLNTALDCAWLREGALRHNNPPPFKACVLHGNEDCPIKLELYANEKPEYNEKEVMVYSITEGLGYAPDRPEQVKTVTLTHPLIEPVTFTVPDGGVLPAASHYEVIVRADVREAYIPLPEERVPVTPIKPPTLAERLKAKGLK